MKNEQFYEALGEINENYIAEVRQAKQKKSSAVWLKWGALAACLCLIFGCLWMIPNPQDQPGMQSQPGPSDSVTVPPTHTQISAQQVSVLSKNGTYTSLPLTQAQVTVNDTVWEYAWTAYEGEIYLDEEFGNYMFARIPGSDRYLSLLTEGGYACLVDVETGIVRDPLAPLDRAILDRLSQVSFSPDGKHALISCNSGTVLKLLDTETGSLTDLPYEDGLYSVSGHFLDSNTLLIISSQQDTEGQLSYSLTRYDIATGDTSQIPGRYVSRDRSQNNFMALTEGPFAYAFTDGKLTIIDLRTMERTVYPLTAKDVMLVSYHTGESVCVVANDTEYLLKTDGTIQTTEK